MTKTKKICKENIGRYELEIARSGCCDSLKKLHFTENAEFFNIEYDDSVPDDLDEILSMGSHEMFDSYRLLLKSLREICKSVVRIEDYLIPACHISLDPEEIAFTEGRAVLRFNESPKETEEAIIVLLNTIFSKHPETHADFLISSLPKHCDAASLCRSLTSMEIDLRNM